MVTADDVVAEMRAIVVDEMPDRSPGETITRCLEAAAYRLGISFSRAQAYWWRKVRQVPAHEADLMRARARASRRRKIAELQTELARLEAELVSETTELGSAGVGPNVDRVAPRLAAQRRR